MSGKMLFMWRTGVVRNLEGLQEVVQECLSLHSSWGPERSMSDSMRRSLLRGASA